MGNMTEDIKVNKDKFDTLFRKMLTPLPLPKGEVTTPRSKPKKKTLPEGGVKIAS